MIQIAFHGTKVSDNESGIKHRTLVNVSLASHPKQQNLCLLTKHQYGACLKDAELATRRDLSVGTLQKTPGNADGSLRQSCLPEQQMS